VLFDAAAASPDGGGDRPSHLNSRDTHRHSQQQQHTACRDLLFLIPLDVVVVAVVVVIACCSSTIYTVLRETKKEKEQKKNEKKEASSLLFPTAELSKALLTIPEKYNKKCRSR